MNRDEENNLRIIKYLKGRMSSEEIENLKYDLKNDTALKELFEDLSHLRAGFVAGDFLSAEHPSAEEIADYAQNQEGLKKDRIDKIAGHLASCPSCHKELVSSREALARAQKAYDELSKNEPWPDRIRKFLFSPSLAMRPAYVALMLIVLAIPIYWGVSTLTTGENVIALEMAPLVRDSAAIPTVEVDPDVNLITLTCRPIMVAGASYDLALMDADNKIIITWPGQVFENNVAIDVPRSYFKGSGIYTLCVTEVLGDGHEKRSYFRIKITFLN